MDPKELVCVVKEDVEFLEVDFVDVLVGDLPVPMHLLESYLTTMLFEEEVGLR